MNFNVIIPAETSVSQEFPTMVNVVASETVSYYKIGTSQS